MQNDPEGHGASEFAPAAGSGRTVALSFCGPSEVLEMISGHQEGGKANDPATLPSSLHAR
jgi:hypothetical protein